MAPKPADLRDPRRRQCGNNIIELATQDIESTGLTPKSDRIIEIAVLRFSPDGERLRFYRRIHPGIPIPASATAVHGITDQDVAACPSFASIAGSLSHFLRDCDLAGFNLKRFDLPFLLAEFARAGIRFSITRRAVIDAWQIYHQREPRTLSAAVRRYLNRDHVRAHSALADAYATAAVLDAQLRHYADLPRTVPELHACFAEVDLSGRLRRENGQLVLTFGKYAGKSLTAIAQADPDYLR